MVKNFGDITSLDLTLHAVFTGGGRFWQEGANAPPPIPPNEALLVISTKKYGRRLEKEAITIQSHIQVFSL